MPKGTRVERMYGAMKDKGYSKGKSARIAQAKTGLSLITGRKPKQKASETIAAGGGMKRY